MVSVGRHELDIVNEALGYRTAHTVNVAPGRVSQISLDWPTGSISVNALPWAEVWIDGKLMGDRQRHGTDALERRPEQALKKQ
jgi:hypothetical protein